MTDTARNNARTAAERAAEKAARQSYGRLVAILSARTRDIAASEDALADAFARALERWPVDGVPDRPEARLLSVARHRTLDAWRHSRVRDEAAQTLLLLADQVAADAGGAEAVPDDRLRLLFVCAHPAIDEAARAPLMLQTVLGLDAARMAGAFLTAPATLGQRLVRAKARIRSAGIPFEFPRAQDLPQRLQDVLDGIYAAYGTGWDDVDGADAKQRGLTSEAIELGRILCELMPREPEPWGLLALMLFCESRAAARRSDAGDYVPLDEQDTALWNRTLRAQAEHALHAAAALNNPGAFQMEAAIQSAHCARRLGADVPPDALVALYDGLLALRPGLGARVSRACALANAAGPAEGLRALDAFTPAQIANYQPYWAARAHLLGETGNVAGAREAYARAAGLSTSPAIRAYLMAASGRL
ncbi:RNA polymerase sigma factor [Variovorax ureilyticus]|uniref:RNA polymerase sigma factor n=1 Tax=Variovorax ureilyticus TaxID=1836198 RepID=UPI003D670D02